MALLSLRLFSLPATHTWMFLSTAETCLASQRSLRFLLYSYSATGFCQQWYPNLRLDLPHKFKVSFPSRRGVCVQSCSGTEDNKSNKFNVFSSPGSAFFSSLKAWCCWNTLLMLPLQSGVKKGGKRRKRAQGVTLECPAPCWTQHGTQSCATLTNSSRTNEDFTTEQLLMPRNLGR